MMPLQEGSPNEISTKYQRGQGSNTQRAEGIIDVKVNEWCKKEDKLNQRLSFDECLLKVCDVKRLSCLLKKGGLLHGLKDLSLYRSLDTFNTNQLEFEEYLKDIIGYEFCTLKTLNIMHNGLDQSCLKAIRECMNQHSMSLYSLRIDNPRESSLEDAFRLNEENDRLRETRGELYEHLSILRLSLRIANRYHIPPRGEALNADVESYEPRPPYRAESPLDIATERQITNRALQHQVN
eukprot:CAMPEP_0171515008 /NCGR_PEP_ID=MMETSP0959-20130129/3190_1 /TAXON_ID=87120 /ORGANISM="Aurantiochytrium limacinum, Strain ATCCMYA-1381" /LENGTH=236 /DNA_ID=CAMNT_0012053455 /DNA_START=136 /DNA_END=843 /DNA_ORIENTATION=+